MCLRISLRPAMKKGLSGGVPEGDADVRCISQNLKPLYIIGNSVKSVSRRCLRQACGQVGQGAGFRFGV